MLCCLAALNAWDKVEVSEETESFSNMIQGPKEAFTDLLQRLTSTVNRIVSDSEVIKILIESLVFENANSECKRMMRPLKARSAPIDEWIRTMAGIGSHVYDAIQIAEIILKRFKKNQNVWCLNCKQGILNKMSCLCIWIIYDYSW